MHELAFQHLRQDVSDFRALVQIQEISPSYLPNMHIKGHIMVRNEYKNSHSVTEGQGNAIQNTYDQTPCF